MPMPDAVRCVGGRCVGLRRKVLVVEVGSRCTSGAPSVSFPPRIGEGG